MTTPAEKTIKILERVTGYADSSDACRWRRILKFALAEYASCHDSLGNDVERECQIVLDEFLEHGK